MDMTNISTEYSHTALSLLGVLALIIVLMYVLKKIRSSKTFNHSSIRIINAMSIGTKEKIILVDVNNTLLLIGATPSHIGTLHVFKDNELEVENTHEYNNFKELLAKEVTEIE